VYLLVNLRLLLALLAAFVVSTSVLGIYLSDAREYPIASPETRFDAATVYFGDVDCGGTVNSIDALKILRATIALSVSQAEPCEDIGVDVTVHGKLQGDVDCDNAVDPVDALRIQRFNAQLSVIQNQPCPAIGTGP
jgi:hypothetical protein